jgi:hypothetical protein
VSRRHIWLACLCILVMHVAQPLVFGQQPEQKRSTGPGPLRLHVELPEYPNEAAQVVCDAIVTLEFTIETDGRVGQIAAGSVAMGEKTVDASSCLRLKQAFEGNARRALERWRYGTTGASIRARAIFYMKPRTLPKLFPAKRLEVQRLPPGSVSGSVVVEAIIQADGSVASSTARHGPADLAPLAEWAVVQWVYEPPPRAPLKATAVIGF